MKYVAWMGVALIDGLTVKYAADLLGTGRVTQAAPLLVAATGIGIVLVTIAVISATNKVRRWRMNTAAS